MARFLLLLYFAAADKISGANPSITEDLELPAGWVKLFDASSQAHYYAHLDSGKTSWVRPEIEDQVETAGTTQGGLDAALVHGETPAQVDTPVQKVETVDHLILV
jgi:hypothetical protein